MITNDFSARPVITEGPVITTSETANKVDISKAKETIPSQPMNTTLLSHQDEEGLKKLTGSLVESQVSCSPSKEGKVEGPTFSKTSLQTTSLISELKIAEDGPEISYEKQLKTVVNNLIQEISGETNPAKILSLMLDFHDAWEPYLAEKLESGADKCKDYGPSDMDRDQKQIFAECFANCSAQTINDLAVTLLGSNIAKLRTDLYNLREKWESGVGIPFEYQPYSDNIVGTMTFCDSLFMELGRNAARLVKNYDFMDYSSRLEDTLNVLNYAPEVVEHGHLAPNVLPDFEKVLLERISNVVAPSVTKIKDALAKPEFNMPKLIGSINELAQACSSNNLGNTLLEQLQVIISPQLDTMDNAALQLLAANCNIENNPVIDQLNGIITQLAAESKKTVDQPSQELTTEQLNLLKQCGIDMSKGNEYMREATEDCIKFMTDFSEMIDKQVKKHTFINDIATDLHLEKPTFSWLQKLLRAIKNFINTSTGGSFHGLTEDAFVRQFDDFAERHGDLLRSVRSEHLVTGKMVNELISHMIKEANPQIKDQDLQRYTNAIVEEFKYI